MAGGWWSCCRHERQTHSCQRVPGGGLHPCSHRWEGSSSEHRQVRKENHSDLWPVDCKKLQRCSAVGPLTRLTQLHLFWRRGRLPRGPVRLRLGASFWFPANNRRRRGSGVLLAAHTEGRSSRVQQNQALRINSSVLLWHPFINSRWRSWLPLMTSSPTRQWWCWTSWSGIPSWSRTQVWECWAFLVIVSISIQSSHTWFVVPEPCYQELITGLHQTVEWCWEWCRHSNIHSGEDEVWAACSIGFFLLCNLFVSCHLSTAHISVGSDFFDFF